MATINIKSQWLDIRISLLDMREPALPFFPLPKRCDRCQAWLTPADKRCLSCVEEIRSAFLTRSHGDVDTTPNPAFTRWQRREGDIVADMHDRLYWKRMRYGEELDRAIRPLYYSLGLMALLFVVLYLIWGGKMPCSPFSWLSPCALTEPLP